MPQTRAFLEIEKDTVQEDFVQRCKLVIVASFVLGHLLEEPLANSCDVLAALEPVHPLLEMLIALCLVHCCVLQNKKGARAGADGMGRSVSATLYVLGERGP